MTIGAATFALGHQPVEEQSRLVALAQAQPADARQALELEPRLAVGKVSLSSAPGVGVARQHPAVQALGVITDRRSLREEFQDPWSVTKMSRASPETAAHGTARVPDRTAGG